MDEVKPVLHKLTGFHNIGQVLKNGPDLSLDDVSALQRKHGGKFIFVPLEDYTDVRTVHIMAASILRVTREENADLRKMLEDPAIIDRTSQLEELRKFEDAVSDILVQVQLCRQAAVYTCKPFQVKLLDGIIQQLEDITPCNDIGACMRELFKTD